MPPSRRSGSHARPEPMWSWSEVGACCVRSATRSIPEWQQLLSAKSMIRYLPPNGTALTARSAVSTPRRSPPPPESTSAMTCRKIHLPESPVREGREATEGPVASQESAPACEGTAYWGSTTTDAPESRSQGGEEPHMRRNRLLGFYQYRRAGVPIAR